MTGLTITDQVIMDESTDWMTGLTIIDQMIMDELTDWLNDWPHLYWPGGHEWAAWVLSHGTWFWSAPRCPPESHGNMQHVNLPAALRTRPTIRRCCMTDRLWCYCKCAVSVRNLACATLLKTQDTVWWWSRSLPAPIATARFVPLS